MPALIARPTAVQIEKFTGHIVRRDVPAIEHDVCERRQREPNGDEPPRARRSRGKICQAEVQLCGALAQGSIEFHAQGCEHD
jgi:hypothetical protein